MNPMSSAWWAGMAVTLALATPFPLLADEAEKGLLDRETLTGDWGGLRSALDGVGFKLSGTYTGEVLGNPAGGIRRRGVAEGLLEIDVDADFDKMAGWSGGTFHLSAFQIHGRGLSSNFVGNLFTLRDIEAAPSTRIWSMWLQQSLFEDAVSLRVGQMPWQEEFAISGNGAYFINGTFGWPIGFAANVPYGGGSYPLASTGLRLKLQPKDDLSVMVAVFDGNVAPGTVPGGDPGRINRDGLNFSMGDPPVVFAEMGWSANQGKEAEGLPVQVKLGGWYHDARFADLHWDRSGRSLADPAGNGIARSHAGNWEIYGIVDRMLWREPGTADNGISAFTRQMVAPKDRNVLPYYGEVGLTWKGMIGGRDDDIAGVAVAYGVISDCLSARDDDARLFGTSAAPSRDHEIAVELLYRGQVAPWLTLVPNAQVVFHPGGGAAMPDNSATRIPDAVVLGLRAILKL